MNRNSYNSLLDAFELHFPNIAEHVLDWYPSGRHEITLKLDDYTKIVYDNIDNSIRTIFPAGEADTDEIPEEAWRQEFGIKLTRKMAQAGLDQNQLAELTGISKCSLSKSMNGKTSPSSYSLLRLARALNCTVSELTEII